MKRGIRQVIGVIGILVLCAHLAIGHAHDDRGCPRYPVQNHQANCLIHNGFMEASVDPDDLAEPVFLPEVILGDIHDAVPLPAPPLPSRPRAPPSHSV